MRATIKLKGVADLSPAPDVTDELLSSTESFIARGESVLFGSADAYINTISVPLQLMMNTGELVKIQDNEYGKEFVGKITGVKIDINSAEIGGEIDITIDVELPV